MHCPNCGNKLNENASFCGNCGFKINVKQNIEPTVNEPIENKTVEPVNTTVETQTTEPIINTQVQTQVVEPTVNVPTETQVIESNVQNDIKLESTHETIKTTKKVNKKILIISIIAILIIVGIVVFIFIKDNNKMEENNNQNNDNPIVEEEKEEVSEEEPKQEDNVIGVKKLKDDYTSGKISVNEYFTQLVFFEFDEEKMDPNYRTNIKYHITPRDLDTFKIFEENYEQLDSKIVKYYVDNKLKRNVKLGIEEPEVTTQANVNQDYKIEMLTENKEDDKIDNTYGLRYHRLDKVKLSSNGKFLIWYTDGKNLTGEDADIFSITDAITDEQADALAQNLESAVYKYEELFGIKYRFNSYVDNKIRDEDYKSAKKLLEKNNISTSVLDNAMSIYVFNLYNNGTGAAYQDEEQMNKLINRSVIIETMDEDGVVNYPYILVNARFLQEADLTGDTATLNQLINHELFHHEQRIYCYTTNNSECRAENELYEAIPNLASALVSETKVTNSFLNNWAGIYKQNIGTDLKSITDYGGQTGYGIFPYFYSYSQIVPNWAEIIMAAHNRTDSIAYIRNMTSEEDLRKVINHAAYYVLTQEYDNLALKSNDELDIRGKIDKNKNVNTMVSAGAVNYYEIEPNINLKVSTEAVEDVTFIVYGYKDNGYIELAKANDKVEIDLAFYAQYDKYYLVVTNGDLLNHAEYAITASETAYQENSEFKTSFDNYNMEMSMVVATSGVEVTTVSKGVVDELHQKQYMEIDNTTMGFTMSNKMYHDFNSGYTYLTQPYGGDVWWKEKSEPQFVDLKNMLQKLKDMDGVTEISKNQYKIKLTGSDVNGLVNSGVDSPTTISGDIYAMVYVENGYISKLEYDFSGLLGNVDKFTATIKFSNYNQAGDVNIPQVVIDNAKEQ